jgi:hypothetical protein
VEIDIGFFFGMKRVSGMLEILVTMPPFLK